MSARPLRIGYGRLAQESNAFAPQPSTVADFERAHLLDSAALHAACGPTGYEAEGFLKNAELSGFRQAVAKAAGVEAVPLFSAWAVPSGPLTESAFTALADRLIASIDAAGPLDGLYLSLHGAMVVVGIEDAEAALMERARAALSPGARFAASFDLHGIITPRRAAAADLLLAYRTNPHRDHARVGRRCGELLISTLRGTHAPTTAWRSLPMLQGGGLNIDFLAPMRAVFKWMKQQERDPKVLYISLLSCHPWNDHPDLGWSVVVHTDGDPALAERLADALAGKAWALRHDPLPDLPDAASALEQARGAWLARRTGAVFLCDASDVVGAGAPGENTHLLKAILTQASPMRALVPLRDAETVDLLWDVAPGTVVDVEVGGRIDPQRSPPLPVTGRVIRQVDTRRGGRSVVLEVDHVQLVLTEHAPIAMQPGFYTDVGLRPGRAELVVVKSLFPFRLFYAAVNRKTIYVRTRGFTDLDLAHGQRFRDPVFPVNDVADWRPADARRRGLASTDSPPDSPTERA